MTWEPAVVDDVDYVQFTGSTNSGRGRLRAAERLIPCSRALAGKDAAIILADAGVAVAAVDSGRDSSRRTRRHRRHSRGRHYLATSGGPFVVTDRNLKARWPLLVT